MNNLVGLRVKAELVSTSIEGVVVSDTESALEVKVNGEMFTYLLPKLLIKRVEVMSENLSLYQLAKSQMSEEDIASHGSDLYLRRNDISEDLVKRFCNVLNVNTFVCEVDKDLWYDIPFAYDPYWENKQAEAKRRKK